MVMEELKNIAEKEEKQNNSVGVFRLMTIMSITDAAWVISE